jgi:hypothetical protein
LDIPAEELPPQVDIEAASKTDTRFGGHFSYLNAVQAYLRKHHGDLSYFEVPTWQLAQAKVFGEHMIIGPTVRTEKAKEAGLPHCLHVVLGVDGEMVWDVHPTRVGLTRADKFGFLGQAPPEWANRPDQIEAELNSWKEGRRDSIMRLCCCPACFVDGEYRDSEA